MPSDREDKTLPSSSDGAAPCVSPPALEKGSHEEKEGEEDADEDEEAAEECRESPRLLSSHPASASRCLREDFHGEKEAGCGGGSSETRKTKSTESERVPVPSQKARFVLERRQSRQSEQKRQGDRDPQGREKTGRRPYGRNKHAAYHASSPIVPFICKPDGLSSVAATQRIIEAVESLVHEFRRAGRGTSSRPLLAASSGRSASLFRTPFLLPCACGPYVSFLYHFVSSLPAAETGVAAAALLASAAMCVVCCLLSNNEASLVSFVRFVIFLPPVLLAAWLAYRSRTIEHLRAVSKLQEALDEFKTETGFASLSGPLSPSQLSPSSSAPRRPGSSALFSHAASSQASSQCPGDEASFIGKETAAHASSPVFRKDERAQAEGLLCSSSGLGGDYPPDYSRLSPAQLFAALQVLVGDSADARFSSLSCSGEAATGRSSAVLHAFEKRPASRLLPAKSGDAVEGKKESRAGAEAVREATAQRTAKGEKRREDKDATGADFAPDDHLPAASLVAVLRDSQWQRVPRNMLAAGDVFKLRPGDPLPCDAVRVVPAFLVSRRHRLNAGGPRRQESPSGMSHRSEHGRAVSACVPPRSELHGERQRTASKAPSPHTGGGPSLRETPSRSLSATALKLSLPSSSRPHSSSSPARSLSESSGSSSRSRSLSRSLSRYLSRSCASSRSSPSSAASSPASQRSTRLVLRPVFSAGVYRVGTVFLPFGSDPARRTGARRASSSLSVSPLTSSPLAGSADGEERAREPRTSSLARFLSPHHGTKRPRRGDRTQRADAPRERLDGASALASSGWESVSRRQAFDADAAYARPRSTQLCPSPSDSDKNDSSRSASRPGRRLRASSPRRRKAFSGASSDASGRRHSPVDSPPRPSRRPYASSRKPRRRGSSPLSFSVDPAGSSSRFKIARGASAGREGRRGRRSREESRRRDALTGREGGEDSRKRSRPSRVSGTTAEQGRDAVRSEGDNQLPSRERRRRTDREDGGASWRSSRRGASDQTRKRRLRDSGKKRWLSDVDEGYWLDSSEDDARSNGHRRRRDLHDDGLRGDGRRDKSARRHLDVRSRRERERGERGRDRHREREKERGREREKESSRARGRERDREGEGRRRRRRERERREESGEPGHASTTLRIRRLSDGDKERGRSGSCGASVAQREERQTCVNRREARERALHGSSRHGNGQGLEDCTERWRASETLAVAAESSFEDETRGRQPLLQAHFKTKSKYVCASLADREATRPLRPRLLGNAPMHSRAPHGDSDDYLLSTRNRENDISETQNAGARPESHSASLTSPPSLPLRFLDFFSRPADQHPTSGLGRKDRESDSGGERGDAGRIGLAASCEEAKQKAAWWEVEELEEELIEAANNDGVAGELKSGTFIALRTSCVGTLRSFLEASLRNPASSKSRAKVPFFEAADLVSRQLAVVWLVACTVCIVFVILWDVIARTGDEVVPLGLRIARWQLPINVTFCMLMAIPRILGELTDIWGNARLQSLFQEAHYRARKDACVDMEGEGRVCRSISSSSWTTDDSSAASSVSSTVSVSNVPISKQIKELIYIFKRGLDGSSNLLHTMNSTTVLCFVDKDGILVDACRTLQEVAVGASSTVHVPAPEAAREASGLPGSPSLHLAGGGQSGTVGTREEEGEEEQEHEQSDDEHESGQGAPDEAARPDREQEEGGREDPNEHDEHDEREEGDERGDHLHSPSLFFANPEDECVDGGFYSFLPVGEHAAPFTLGRKPKSTRMRSTTTGPGAARAADTRAKAMKRQEREGEEREEPTRVSVWRSKDFEPSDERCDQLRRERDSVHSKNDDGSGMTRELPSSIPATDTEAGQREKSGACVDSAHAEASERSRELPEERLETEEANALPREARNKRSFFSFTATRPSEQSRQLLEPLGAPRRLPTEEEEFQESAMQSRDESPASSPARLPSSLASSVASLLPSLQRSRAATQKRSREAGRADERDALRERREGADGRAHGPEGEEEREHEGEEDARQTSGDSETEERREDAEWGVSAVDAERFVQSDLSEEHDEEGDERGEERRSEEARREDREEEERRVEEERRADEAHGLREEEEDYTRERHAQDSQVLLRPVTEFRKVVLDLMNDDECVVGLRFENVSCRLLHFSLFLILLGARTPL
ncbi:putative transmembrane protein, partial [Toxoplasma gondii CAST]